MSICTARIHIIYTLKGDAEIVDGLLLAYDAAVGTHLKVGGQAAVTEAGLYAEAVVQLILKCQRPCNGHAMMAGAQNLILAGTVGIV